MYADKNIYLCENSLNVRNVGLVGEKNHRNITFICFSPDSKNAVEGIHI
jgi:hypothetical protein